MSDALWRIMTLSKKNLSTPVRWVDPQKNKKNNNKKNSAHSHLGAVFALCAEAQIEIQAISAFSRCGMKAEDIIGREPFGCSGWNVPRDPNWAAVKPLMYIRVISVIWLCVCVCGCVCAGLFTTQRQSGPSGLAEMTRGALETGRNCQTCTQPFQTVCVSAHWTSRLISSLCQPPWLSYTNWLLATRLLPILF